MLVCFGLFGLLLYNTVVANAVCSFTYSHRDQIKALSLQYEKRGYTQRRCDYHIRAPHHAYVQLNFTRLFGFSSSPPSMPSASPSFADKSPPRDYNEDSAVGASNKNNAAAANANVKNVDAANDACLPPEVVLKERSDGETQIGRICNTNSNRDNNRSVISPDGSDDDVGVEVLSPRVFHSKLNIVKITYIWVENHSSGFTVDFEFHHYNNSCVHICDERECLSQRQLCNGQSDCTDASDERKCPPHDPSTKASPSSPNADLIKTLAVILIVVLMPGLFVVICVVSPCRLGSRMWRRRRRSRERIEHSQIRPESQVCEVVYVPSTGSPGTSQDKLLEKQISTVREHRIRVRSAQTDTMLDLPPQIAISKDGEEGYIESQKHIMCKRPYFYDQVFRPPPNRTVHDRESPPPYYSNSASVENLESPPTRIVRDSNGYPKIQRCYSMSSSVASSSASSRKSERKQSSSSEAKTHSRTMSSVSAEERTRTRTVSASFSERTDEPPDLRTVVPSDIKQVSPHVDSNV